MAYDYSASLNPQKALIWRIVHRDNIPWILDNGLHCGNSLVQAENWINIGNPELIGKRA
ncbi:DarT ssDNA thymidine ADP-ribosyltransferase family protein, partial [Escherichia coli]|nr:DarT ssDNA thymidine ADP-ribosyltransferase family protein [Escherichia coli]